MVAPRETEPAELKVLQRLDADLAATIASSTAWL